MRRRTLAIVLAMLMVASTLVLPPISASEGEGEGGDTLEPIVNFSKGVGRYLGVAPVDWEDSLRPLMDWRDRTSGYTSLFLPLEDAIANGQGQDRAAKLKYSIKYADAKVVLLVGDSEVIPVRKVFTDILQDGNQSDPLNFRWTDDYYTIGSEYVWNKDGDGIYGEDGEILRLLSHPSMWSEGTLVGRIPASTELEVERFVAKLLAYERTPPPGDWFTSALLVSGLMDVPNDLDNPYTPDVDGGYEIFSDNAYESHSQLMDIIPDRFERTWLYDYPQLEGGHWNRSVDILDHDSVVTAFDQGHSMVAMNGHGYTDGSGLAHYNGSGYSNYWWDWHSAYDYADADNASNGGRLPWVYVAACYVGDITVKDDRTLERLVMNPDGGAVGLVAGNGENYKGESMANASFGNWYLERHFWTYYLKYGPGRAMLYTKWAYLSLVSSDEVPHTPLYDAYYVADYLSPNLLGDPRTQVWTDVPGTLRVSSFLDEEEYGEAVHVTVVDGQDEPVANARVYIGWDGNHTKVTTDQAGNARLMVPLDAGMLEMVVSAKDHIPASAEIERPVNLPDLEVTGISWDTGTGGVDGPVLKDEEVTLMASITTHGRYDFDQARVRFSVAPENGDFERLVPDVFAAVFTGEHPVAETTWTPPWPGTWQVRAEVNPAAELPDASIMNNFGGATLVVLGPPRWDTLPDRVSLTCDDGPGAIYDLLVHVSDPDTSREDLTVTAEAVGPVPGGVTFHIDDGGALVVCSSLTRASFTLDLEVTDGTYTDGAELKVQVGRTAPRLLLVGEAFLTATEGDTVTGTLSISNLGPGEVEEGLVIVDLSGNLLFTMTPEGRYTFEAVMPGTYQVRVGIQRQDGSTEDSWEDAVLSFSVSPGAGLPPQPYGWTDIHVAEGQKATVHLQAVDLEGGTVTYELTGRDGLEASIDPATGMLTIRPGEDDVGKHTLTLFLTDGTESEEFVLQVYVTEPPSSGLALWIVLGMAVVLIAGAVVIWALKFRQDQD